MAASKSALQIDVRRNALSQEGRLALDTILAQGMHAKIMASFITNVVGVLCLCTLNDMDPSP